MSKLIDKILREGNIKSSIFPVEFINNLGHWILWYNGYNKRMANIILKYSNQLDKEFKSTNAQYLFRAVKWNNKIKGYGEGIRSWSESLDAVKEYIGRGEVEAYNNSEYVVILKIPVEQNRIVINLQRLIGSKKFKVSLQQWEEEGDLSTDSYLFDGMDVEKEIIYNQPVITQKDICLVQYNGQYYDYKQFLLKRYGKEV